MSSPGLVAWKLAFQLSPIVLTGGIATGIPGSMLPIIALTEGLNFTLGLLTGEEGPTLDNFFANYEPMPGTTLIDQSVGEYPFANQTVAANAVIANPLVVSLKMICPVRQKLGYFTKLATMMSLKASLDQHNGLGGTYIVAMPTNFYVNMLLISMRDVTGGESAQRQTDWQLDFRKPLLTLNDAQAAQSSLMSKLTNSTQINGEPAWSGVNTVTGDASSLGGIGTIQSLQNVAGAGISPPR
jgi:hypothetical protein